ncbi:MAG: phytanoyl-CoA dioxygenase family protein [Actinomycetota bacterium]
MGLGSYEDDGFAVLRGFLEPAVVAPILDAVGRDALVVLDAEGRRQHVNTWTWCGDDLIGRMPRAEPIVEVAEAVVAGPVHHWHSKISWKDPGSDGTWDWHQDYAFWIEEGVARPAMATIGIALDHHTAANGCLRVVPRSHRAGVIDHPAVGNGRAAEPEILERLVHEHGVVEVELEPGDAIVFHCSLLHGSGPNRGDETRTFLHCSYNAVDNPASDPFIDGHQVHRLDRVPAAAIQPGSYERVWGDTAFIQPEATGYGGRSGYQVLAADG